MHLFPQLHTLHFEDKNPEQCQNILLFLSPSLIRLTLRNHHGEAIFKVCEAVAYRARYLKHLDIPNPPFALPTFDSPANEIREFPRLNSLTTLDWKGEIMRLKAFSSLSTLPNLIKLTLNTLHLEPLQDRCSIPRLPFTALQVLTLQVRNFSTMIDLILSSIGAPHLSEFVLILTQDETLIENNVRSLLSALSTRKKLASITVSASLALVRPSVWGLPSHYPEDMIDGATLEPLLKVRGLVKLDLSRLACRISDSTLQRLARQWRLMEDLRLGSSCHESMPVASFSGLQAVVTGCPRLKILGIPLDTSPQPSSIFATSQRTASYTCTEYHVLGRDPRDPIRVAALLSDILPAASIHSCATSEGWTLIGKLVKPFAEVRREERQRAEEASRQCSKRSSIFSNFT